MTIYHEKSMFLSKNGFINKSRAAIHGEAPSFFSQIFKFRSDESEAYSSSRSLGISLIFLAGTPPTRQLSGTSCVTTAPAAMTTLFPIVTPGTMMTLPPIHTSFPIVTGFAMPRLFLLPDGDKG